MAESILATDQFWWLKYMASVVAMHMCRTAFWSALIDSENDDI